MQNYTGPGGPIEVAAPFDEVEALEALPMAALMIASFAAAPDQRGIEVDAVLVDADARSWYVSARHEPHGVLTLAAAPSDPTPPVAAGNFPLPRDVEGDQSAAGPRRSRP